MKLAICVAMESPISSHPPRGAWVEIVLSMPKTNGTTSHPPRGAWVEIFRH